MFKKFLKKTDPKLLVAFVALVLILVCAIYCPHCSIFLPFLKKNGSLSENFDNSDEKRRKKVVYAMFYAPWCGYCKRTMPTWDRLMAKFKGDENVEVIKVNCEEDKEMAKKHGISSYPTIRILNNGLDDSSNFAEYKGDRSFDDLSSFIKGHLDKLLN